MQQEDEQVELPDLRYEGQCQGNARTDDIERDEQSAARDPVRDGAGDGGDADVGHHLDGEDGTQHHRRVPAREIVGKEAQRNRREPRPDEGRDLCGEEMAIRAVGQNLKHEWPESLCSNGWAAPALAPTMRL